MRVSWGPMGTEMKSNNNEYSRRQTNSSYEATSERHTGKPFLQLSESPELFLQFSASFEHWKTKLC